MKYVQLFLCIYLIAVIFFLAHFLVVGKAVYGDGRYYYSYLPTFFIQHTLNFIKSYDFFGLTGQMTTKGTIGNIYSIGPAAFWTIPYYISYFLISLGGNNSLYSIFPQIFVGLWNVTAVCFGLYVLWLILLKYFTRKNAFFAICATFFTTNLFFYGSLDVINSHSAGFFFATLLLFLSLKKPTRFYAFLQGCLVGILALIRIQDSIFLFIPFVQFLTQKKYSIMLYLLFSIGFFLLLSPQFFLWNAMWGNFLKSPYLYQHGFNVFHPNILGVLFGIKSGLFFWTPSIYIALFGLFLFSKRERRLALSFFLIFLLELFIIASWDVWWEGASYSARMFITTLPLLSFGFAEIFEKIQLWKRYFFLYLFTGLNFFLIVIFLLFGR